MAAELVIHGAKKVDDGTYCIEYVFDKTINLQQFRARRHVMHAIHTLRAELAEGIGVGSKDISIRYMTGWNMTGEKVPVEIESIPLNALLIHKIEPCFMKDGLHVLFSLGTEKTPQIACVRGARSSSYAAVHLRKYLCEQRGIETYRRMPIIFDAGAEVTPFTSDDYEGVTKIIDIPKRSSLRYDDERMETPVVDTSVPKTETASPAPDRYYFTIQRKGATAPFAQSTTPYDDLLTVLNAARIQMRAAKTIFRGTDLTEMEAIIYDRSRPYKGNPRPVMRGVLTDIVVKFETLP